MDKKTITGFVLMGIVLLVFTWLGRPSQEEMARQKQIQDSIAALKEPSRAAALPSTQTNTVLPPALSDSAKLALATQQYGDLAAATQGQEQIVTLRNDSVVVSISTRGGFVVGTELLQFKDYEGKSVKMIRPESSKFSYTFVTANNRVISTSDLYFRPEQIAPNQLRMSLQAANGQTLSFLYTLKEKYMLDVKLESNGFSSIVAANAPYLDFHISLPVYQNEKSFSTEARYSGIAYEHSDGDVEKLSTSKEETENINGSIKWVAFRDMFFSTVLYSPSGLERATLKSFPANEKSGKVKDFQAVLSLPFPQEATPTSLLLYLGPNDYNVLKAIDKEIDADTSLTKIVDMGDWFRFINVWLVIPIFTLLEKVFSNYGLIIFLLTLIIKLLLMPFTYKSYLSTAKMKVLRPQVEEINAKYPGDDKMMERQRATMELYRRAGVSTMGGCLPMLLQMPFLVAMYQYFPTSINLRGESFLWAKDLSTYDDVIHLGFNIPFIGDHISLFCLLMTITQIVYMKISQANTPQAMPAMKMMPYFMAIMLFVFLNQNSAGLSYYYFLSMLITIVQTMLFRWSVNEDKILAQLEENKKKPLKKSKFMLRLEELQKQQAELQKQQAKRKK